MDSFFRTAAGVLLTVFLMLNIQKREAALTMAVSVACCISVCLITVQYLIPVSELIAQLVSLGDLGTQISEILLKITGIGLITQIAVPICTDSGHAALGKALQILCAGATLYLCIPVFHSYLELLQEILGKVS